MDFAFTDEQQHVRDLARQILGDLVTSERLRELEAGDEGIDRRAWRALAEANLLGVAIDEAHGGSGLGFFTLCVLLGEVGRAVAPVPALACLVGAALPLQRFGSDAQRARWLPRIASGEAILSAALCEAGGADPEQPTTTATRSGGAWTLSGAKILVPAAAAAERILVPARTAQGAGLFLVEPGAPGVGIERQRSTDRQAGYALALDGVRVDEADALGLAAPEALAWLVAHASVASCAVQVGVSERALEMTAEYARTRVQFERPIGSFQAVHQRAADAYIQLEAMRLTAWDAAWRLEAGEAAGDEVAIARYWAAEAGQFVGYAAQHLHGGIGIDVDYPLHRYYLWAKQLELGLGSAPVQLAALGDRLAAGV